MYHSREIVALKQDDRGVYCVPETEKPVSVVNNSRSSDSMAALSIAGLGVAAVALFPTVTLLSVGVATTYHIVKRIQKYMPEVKEKTEAQHLQPSTRPRDFNVKRRTTEITNIKITEEYA